MARLSKEDHPKILQAVDVEHRKVAELAVQYGCTPAAIYAVLVKLRKAAGDAEAVAKLSPMPAVEAVDLFAAPAMTPGKPAGRRAAAAPPPQPPAPPVLVVSSPPVPVGLTATVTDLPSRLPRPAAGRGGVGASLARPAYGLVMRTSDGEESMTPFRSLDDLLSAIKPVLRSAARSPDPVWFSIQPVDLAAVDSDAA